MKKDDCIKMPIQPKCVCCLHGGVKMSDPWNINWGGNDLSGVIVIIVSIVVLGLLFGNFIDVFEVFFK